MSKSVILYSALFIIGIAGFAISFSGHTQAPVAVDKVVVDKAPVKIPPPITVQPDGKPQSLETETAKIITSTGKTYAFVVELAKTREQQRIGMMYRMKAEPLTGMLFLFDEEKERSFWMKNTFIPLDIIFIKKDGVIAHIHSNAEPQSLVPVKSGEPVVAVLEIYGGEAKKLGVNVGNRVDHSFFQEVVE